MIYADKLDSILRSGRPWPPESEISRIRRFEENEMLFAGEHIHVYKALRHLFANPSAEYNKVLVILNWHRRLSTLWADFLFGEPPALSATDPAADEYLHALIRRTNFWAIQHARQIDVSRFGIGITELYQKDGKAWIDVVHPSKYIEIVDEFGKTAGHLLWWISEGETRVLNIKIHTIGYVTLAKYAISSDGLIKEVLEEPEQIPTNIDDSLVSVVTNITTSSRELHDDYADIDPIVKRLETRLTRVGRILDVHSEPVFYAPEDSGAFVKTEDGRWIFDASKKAFAIEDGKIAPGYVTWDGQLNAAFDEIDNLLRQLYTISETCEACFEPSKIGSNISGTALRLMLFMPLRKVDRLKMYADPAIRRELRIMNLLERNIEPTVPDIGDCKIIWQDGLPEDWKETVSNVVLLKSQGLISDRLALKLLYKLAGEPLEAELSEVSSENMLRGE